MHAGQLKRWIDATITVDQREEVERLTALFPRLRDAIIANLDLVAMLKGTTIEAILGKSNLELDLEFPTRIGIFGKTLTLETYQQRLVVVVR